MGLCYLGAWLQPKLAWLLQSSEELISIWKASLENPIFHV